MRDTVKNQTTSADRPRRTRRRAALTTAAVGVVLVAGIPGIAAAAPAAPAAPVHGMGAIPPKLRLSAVNGRARLAAAVQAAGGMVYAASALPASVDLTGFAVTPGNQGSHGACGSFTTAYTLAGWESNYTHHVGAPFDPMYVYNQINGGSDTRGTSFGGNYSILENQGVVEAAYWTHPFSDYRTQPTAAERADAAQHKLTTHTGLFSGQGQGTAAQTAIETALANNQPVGIAFPVYSAFEYLNTSHSSFGLADATGSVLGYHAVAVLGYDANGVTIENSWGTGWGNHGFATMGWDFVESKVMEAVASGSFVSGANTLAPVVTTLSKAGVNTAGGTALTITAARLGSVNTSTAGSVKFVSVANPAVSVNATATVTGSTTLSVTTPALPADGDYRVVLTGSGGTSVPNATADVVTALHPGTVALVGGQVGRSDAVTKVTLVGSGFGTTSTAFVAAKLTATVAGKAAPLTWINDEHVQVAVPAAAAGTTAQIVISRNGVASPAVTVSYLPPLPVVSTLSPAHVSVAGGTTVTATVKAASTATGVTLVSTTDPSVTLTATLGATTATTVTFTTPASSSEGTYHVVVTGSGGTSLPVAADVLTYRTPMTGTTSATVASAAGGTAIPVSGSGFGSTSTAFAALKLTATVGGKATAVKWVSDTSLVVTVPAGVPGAAASIVLVHDGVPGAAVTGAKYAAVITANSAQAGPLEGWTTKLTGVGFTGSGSWALLDGAGQTVASLPVVTTTTALAAASSGAVLITGPTAVSVHLPAASEGMYRLTFTPSASAFPGASFAFTSRAVVIYSALG
ncbi:MAG: IPT/TIG domain-containing protein [Blastococcus sp.]